MQNYDSLVDNGSGKDRASSILERVMNALQSLKSDLTELLMSCHIVRENLESTISHLDECYNCLNQLKQVVKNSKLYYCMRNIFEGLPSAYVSIEAYQNGFLSLPVLKSALMKSGVLNEIEKIVSIIEARKI
ncbi:MAG: hypothetical protein KIH08_03280 [Candidatus Freyarchaeota archaeon]|nr:hypothetical protein [Candidatus Jordarchaeia archaeon]MBS7270434.1 hypothetical protein [Candidatus Jordarchaeia archaeon]MBS7281206.1 hypothetical protein [Candidatus Jordarchaeia archaeon]